MRSGCGRQIEAAYRSAPPTCPPSPTRSITCGTSRTRGSERHGNGNCGVGESRSVPRSAFNEAVDLFGANNDPVMAVAHQMNSSVPPG